MYSSITDLRNAVSQHTVGLQKYRWNPTVIHSIWNKLLHDRRMPSKRRMTRKHGGAAYELTGAPLDYAMVPGSAFTTDPAVAVYDRFPIDPTVNPQVVSDLDVFFGSALSRGCGIENSSLTVPADMGSNQVGGKRRRTLRQRKQQRQRQQQRQQRGGASEPGIIQNAADLASSVKFHPYMDAGRPSLPHSLTHQWQGRVDQIPTSPDPTDHTWGYASEKPLPVMDTNQFTTQLDAAKFLYQTTAMGPSAATGGARRKSVKRKKTRRGATKSKARKH